MRAKRLKCMALVAAIPFVLALLFVLFEHVRGRILLAHAERSLRSMGLKLEASEFALPSAVGENGAPAVFEASRQLAKGSVLPDNNPPRMRSLPSGRAIIGFREEQWVDGKTTNDWRQVALDLETNAAALQKIVHALQKPVLRNEMNFSLGARMPFDHLAHAKGPASWFATGAQLALRQGDRSQALDYLLAGARLPNAVAEDRILIRELVRIAIVAISRTATWEALQFDGWSDEDLARLQVEWQRQSSVAQMIRALEGEVVFMHETYKGLRKSHAETVRTLFWLEDFTQSENLGELAPETVWGTYPFAEFIKKQIYARIWRIAWIDHAQARMLLAVRDLIRALQEGAAAKNVGPILGVNERFAAQRLSRGFYDRLRCPEPLSDSTLGMAALRAFRAETEAQMTTCAIALKRYALRNGKLPAALADLVPSLLPSAPMDYMDGTPLKYRLDSDQGFLLYSSGTNQKDDGGDSSLRPDSVQSRNPWDRLDFLWPLPARQDEIEGYHLEQQRSVKTE